MNLISELTGHTTLLQEAEVCIFERSLAHILRRFTLSTIFNGRKRICSTVFHALSILESFGSPPFLFGGPLMIIFHIQKIYHQWKGGRACIFNVAIWQRTKCNTGTHPQREAINSQLSEKTNKQSNQLFPYPIASREVKKQWSRDAVSTSGFSGGQRLAWSSHHQLFPLIPSQDSSKTFNWTSVESLHK